MNSSANTPEPQRAAAQPRIYRPAIYILPDELQYMRLMDVIRLMNQNASIGVTKILTTLTAFQALAPLCIEKERIHEPDLRITDEGGRRVYSLADFNESMDEATLERLYLNIRWATRIIQAHERKGSRAEVELHPLFGFFGPRRRKARVYLIGKNSSFLM